MPPRHIHIGGTARVIQLPQLASQPGCMSRLYARLAATDEKLLDTFVPKSLNHGAKVYLDMIHIATYAASNSATAG